MIILVDPMADGMADAAGLAAQHGWPCRTCASLATVDARADDIVLHAGDVTANPVSLPAVAPTIALASAAWIAGTDWAERGYVATIDRALLAEGLPTVMTEWSHAARLAALDQLADTFGTAPMARLVAGLRQMLETVPTIRDSTTLAAEAHRIAGFAGMLGFTALGQHWQRVAEGARPPSTATLIATRHALDTLDIAQIRGTFTIS